MWQQRKLRRRRRVPELRERHGLRGGELLGRNLHEPKNVQRHRDLRDPFARDDKLWRIRLRRVELQDQLRRGRRLRERELLRERSLYREEDKRQRLHRDEPMRKRKLCRWILLQFIVRRRVPVVQTHGVARNLHEHPKRPRPRQRMRRPGRRVVRNERLV